MKIPRVARVMLRVVALIVAVVAGLLVIQSTIYTKQGGPFYALQRLQNGLRNVSIWQGGELVTTPVTDWSFVDDVPDIRLRTQTPVLFRYWVNTYIARHGQQLYLFSSYAPLEVAPNLRFPEGRQWNRNLARNHRARVKIRDRLFDMRAYPLTDPVADADHIARAHEAFTTKYHRLAEAGAQHTIGGRVVDLSTYDTMPVMKRPRMQFWRLEPQ